MDPRLLLALVFIGFPLLELYIMIEVGAAIGGVTTIFIIVFTGVFGVLLLRHQGTVNISRMRKSLDQGELPALAMFESVFIFAAAIMLLIPGFITDALGLMFLITPVRLAIINKVLGLPRFQMYSSGFSENVSEFKAGSSDPNTIEGEYKREDDNDKLR